MNNNNNNNNDNIRISPCCLARVWHWAETRGLWSASDDQDKTLEMRSNHKPCWDIDSVNRRTRLPFLLLCTSLAHLPAKPLFPLHPSTETVDYPVVTDVISDLRHLGVAPRRAPSASRRCSADCLVRLPARNDGRYQEHKPEEPQERGCGLGLAACFFARARGASDGVVECFFLWRALTIGSWTR